MDVRKASSFDAQHAEGAINVPLFKPVAVRVHRLPPSLLVPKRQRLFFST